jgi:sec-independent protein translocase protein TatA
MIGWTEVLVILIVVLIVFGAGRFPSIMENFARGLKAFKKTMAEENGPAKTGKGTPAKRRPKKR